MHTLRHSESILCEGSNLPQLRSSIVVTEAAPNQAASEHWQMKFYDDQCWAVFAQPENRLWPIIAHVPVRYGLLLSRPLNNVLPPSFWYDMCVRWLDRSSLLLKHQVPCKLNVRKLLNPFACVSAHTANPCCAALAEFGRARKSYEQPSKITTWQCPPCKNCNEQRQLLIAFGMERTGNALPVIRRLRESDSRSFRLRRCASGASLRSTSVILRNKTEPNWPFHLRCSLR